MLCASCVSAGFSHSGVMMLPRMLSCPQYTISCMLHSVQPKQRIAGHGRAPSRGVAHTGIVVIAPSSTFLHLICGLEGV